MNRVAALYDIHGNLPALEAVLGELAGLSVDRVVIGGDVLPGPMPRECLARLEALPMPVHFLYGNGEIAVLEEFEGREPARVPAAYRPVIAWNARQLDSEQARRISAWPATVRMEIPGLGDVLFCHATPHNENEIFTRLTPEDRLAPIFGNVDAALVICGHTHMQFDRKAAGVRVVNAGSVGMPFGQPGADWLLLGPGVDLRHTDYDLARAAEQIQATEYPDAANFAAHSVLNPPSEESMLERFAAAELRK